MTPRDQQTTIVRTSRGLSIAGTRLTLYTILDHLHAGWSPRLIQQWFNLAESQITDILSYIEQNRDAVEAEYEHVIAQAEAQRQYWEGRNREQMVLTEPVNGSPEQQAIWEKLQTWKKELHLS
ncbi:MAG: DUF433 domain-containing protein [Herpetosiphon sp.]|nr:DUF433 domain-containing protein [Herpetosiphon sp.]